MIYVVIILFFIGLLVFMSMSAGVNDAKAQDATLSNINENNRMSKVDQDRIYQELTTKTSRYAESIGKIDLAHKIRSGKFDYQDLKRFEIRYMK